MKDYILEKIEANVICVDWSKPSDGFNVFWVVPRVPITGQMVAHFINRLINATNVSPNDIQCIGHSLGAHVCGHIGKALHSRGIKLAKITGLDPAWLGFDHRLGIVSESGLDKIDANLVLVMHTSSGFDLDAGLFAGFIGHPNNLGHFDFRINGGKN